MRKVIIVALVLFCVGSNALASMLNDFDRYEITVKEALKEIQIQPLQKEPDLYETIVCIAISAENNIAVWSGPAPDAGYKRVISIYGSDGTFLCAYETNKTQNRGMDTIFFVGDELCAYFTVYNIMLVLDIEGGGVTHAYSLTELELAGFSDGRFIPMISVNDVKIDPEATHLLVEYTNGRVVVANSQGQQICLYDHSDQFQSEKRKSMIKIIAAPVFIALMLMIVFRPPKRKKAKLKEDSKFNKR